MHRKYVHFIYAFPKSAHKKQALAIPRRCVGVDGPCSPSHWQVTSSPRACREKRPGTKGTQCILACKTPSGGVDIINKDGLHGLRARDFRRPRAQPAGSVPQRQPRAALLPHPHAGAVAGPRLEGKRARLVVTSSSNLFSSASTHW
ncbi:hypothetical protein FA95DRAFT_1559866 [Auriscalpium vulgare]|uniref:Uncharacterized protein n=1 Tax=Auriscalpium vulgare TaxID=40419 RepID=A0ACB8RR44_9AGAM|nr:hypothetical protein FA95DRAFT_1559866 [Auriscalpium vulgare]